MAFRHTAKYCDYRGLSLVTAPAIEPVTADEVKAQLELEVSDTSRDSQIELYIQASRQVIEQLTGLALITQTWRMTIDHWPGEREEWWDGVRDGAISDLVAGGRKSNIILPRYPLQSVDSVDADGQPVTVGDTFIVDTQEQPGRLVIKRGVAWPVVLDNANGIEIEFMSGFGSSSSDVPAALRLAIMQMAAYMFEHRGDCNTDSAYKMSGAESLVSSYRAARL